MTAAVMLGRLSALGPLTHERWAIFKRVIVSGYQPLAYSAIAARRAP